MDISDDDVECDRISKPKFNSTALGSDEQSHSPNQAVISRPNTLRLSPIPRHQTTQLIDAGDNPLSEQQLDNMINEREQCQKDLESGLKSSTADKECEDMGASESRIFSNTSAQPKSNSTGRSRITNPFDSDLMESLCTTTYSPGLFDSSERDVEREDTPDSFRWSIGQMAELHPADIDETEPMCQTPDPVEEAKIHSAIDKFWASQKYVVPSPQLDISRSDGLDSPSSVLKRRAVYQESPLARKFYKEPSQSTEVQTMFTFPPNLDLVGLLGNCFQYEEGGEVAVFEANLSLDTLRRKLFVDTILSQSSQTTASENPSLVSVAVGDDDPKPFGDERPSWYHSDDEEAPSRNLSFDDVSDPVKEAEISARFSSPDVSPIKKQ